jgi:hypothetical protein
MKYKASMVVENPLYLENKWFSSDPNVIRDNQNACYISLREVLWKYGIDLATEDINPVGGSDIVIRLNVGRKVYSRSSQQKSYLIITEPEFVIPGNWDRANHESFDRVFTWNEMLVDNNKYFLLRMAYKFGLDRARVNMAERKLCTMIAGYKFARHRNELYSERLAAINWFTKNHPEDFELYGAGWPSYRLPFLGRGKTSLCGFIATRVPKSILKMVFPRNTAYRGGVKSKHETLRKYRFSICYENMKDMPGYITEKIFDSFSAGCIPIYWGASNITELIPSNCFIDKRKYVNYEELCRYISGIDEKSYGKYIDNIESFLNSDSARIFSADHFAQTLSGYILKDLRLV